MQNAYLPPTEGPSAPRSKRLLPHIPCSGPSQQLHRPKLTNPPSLNCWASSCGDVEHVMSSSSSSRAINHDSCCCRWVLTTQSRAFSCRLPCCMAYTECSGCMAVTQDAARRLATSGPRSCIIIQVDLGQHDFSGSALPDGQFVDGQQAYGQTLSDTEAWRT